MFNFTNTSFISDYYTTFTDIANVYILPLICLTSIILNFISVMVILNMGFKKDPLNQYILVSSICNFITLILTSFTFLLRCGNLCQISCKFGSKVYELYVHLFFSNILIQFNLLLDAMFTFNRLISFSNYKFKNKKWFLNLLKLKYGPMLILPILTNMPIYLIVRDITDINDHSCFRIVTNETGKNPVMKSFLLCLALFRGAILLLLIFCMNIMIQYKFSNFITKKNKVMTISTINKQTSILIF